MVCKIYRRMCEEKNVLVKNLYKLTKHGFATMGMTVYVVDTLWLSGKENFLGIAVNKEGYAA